MQTMTQDRLLTELDHVRLTNLLQREHHGVAPGVAAGHGEEIEEVLEGAEVVPSRQIQADVVTMNSQVELVDGQTQARSRYTLCYPAQANAPEGCLSILSPLGAALIGLRVGAVAQWQGPGGTTRSARVAAILFQPEASGDYTA